MTWGTGGNEEAGREGEGAGQYNGPRWQSTWAGWVSGRCGPMGGSTNECACHTTPGWLFNMLSQTPENTTVVAVELTGKLATNLLFCKCVFYFTNLCCHKVWCGFSLLCPGKMFEA